MVPIHDSTSDKNKWCNLPVRCLFSEQRVTLVNIDSSLFASSEFKPNHLRKRIKCFNNNLLLEGLGNQSQALFCRFTVTGINEFSQVTDISSRLGSLDEFWPLLADEFIAKQRWTDSIYDREYLRINFVASNFRQPIIYQITGNKQSKYACHLEQNSIICTHQWTKLVSVRACFKMRRTDECLHAHHGHGLLTCILGTIDRYSKPRSVRQTGAHVRMQ